MSPLERLVIQHASECFDDFDPDDTSLDFMINGKRASKDYKFGVLDLAAGLLGTSNQNVINKIRLYHRKS